MFWRDIRCSQKVDLNAGRVAYMMEALEELRDVARRIRAPKRGNSPEVTPVDGRGRASAFNSLPMR